MGAFVAMQPANLLAQATEPPPSFNAAKIANITRVGTNYTIENPVRSDGLLRVYVLATPYGKFTVRGDAMLRMRTNELKALALLEKVSESDAFGQALVKAGLNPLKYTGQLITNPLGTIENTLGGVDAMFKRFHAGMAHAGKTRDNEMDSLLGVTDERRALATAYGVDPYTDFPPLDAKLRQLSQAAAAGGLVVTGALMAVPGAPGLIVSNLSTVTKISEVRLADVARQYTAPQLREHNHRRLIEMGVDEALAERLLDNRNYTPLDITVIVAALHHMPQVQGREIFVERAAGASERFIAYFTRIHAELLIAAYQRRPDFVRFVVLGGFPFLVTKDNRALTVAPIDALAWTAETAPRLTEAFADRKRKGFRSGELLITGDATSLAERHIKANGWAVLEQRRP
jgi:hypothetical protein